MRRLQWLVWNRAERRLRAPWRLLAGMLFFFVVSIAAVLALGPIALYFGIELFAGFGPTTRPLAINAVLGVVVTAAIVPAGWFLDRRRLSDYGLRIDRQWWTELGAGLFVGAAAMTGVAGVGIAGGWFVVDGVGLSSDSVVLFGLLIGVFIIVGVYEELLVRGYLLTNLAEGFRWFDRLDYRLAVAGATVLSSGAFGALHFMNPNATLLSSAVISAAGVMLAVGYLYTGELAMPIGIHITWNIFQGLVYGLPVSGVELPVTLVGTATRGPATVSGGAFGPEAGLLGLFGVGLATVGILAFNRIQYGIVALVAAVSTPDLLDS